VKSIAGIAAALTILVANLGAASAGEIRVPYVERAIGDSDSRKFWADTVSSAGPLGQYAPWILVGKVNIGGGRTLTVTQMWAGGLCTGKECPLRIYEGDELLVDTYVCDIPEEHRISDDGRMLLACDTAIRTNRR